MLNRRGGIESDLTVTRLGDDRFRLVIGTAFGSRDLAWIRRHQDGAERALVRDVTSSLACLGIWGPGARDVLESVCDDDLSNDGFRYLTARDIEVGGRPVPGRARDLRGRAGLGAVPLDRVRRAAVGSC